MHIFFNALFRMPIWMLLLVALGLGWLGHDFRETLLQEAAEKAELRASPQPPVGPVSAFDPEPEGRNVVEAHVTARWAPEYNTKLFTTKNGGSEIADGTLLVLLDESATAETDRRVAAVIVVRPNDHDRLVDWMVTHLADEELPHPLVRLEGLVRNATESRHVGEVMEKHGLIRGPNFFYLDPYLDGRVAALTPDPDMAESGPWLFWGLALALVALAGVRLVVRVKKGPSLPQPALRPAVGRAGGVERAQPADPARRKPWALIGVGMVVLGLLDWSGWGLALLPVAFVLFAMSGFRVAARKATDSAVLALDRLTGAAVPQRAAEGLPMTQAGPAFARPASPSGPIISTPSLGQQSIGLLRDRRFTQWLPFFGALAAMTVGGYLAAGPEGVKDRFGALLAPFTGPAQMVSISEAPSSTATPVPAGRAAADAPDVAALSDAAIAAGPMAAYRHAMLMLGVTLAFAFAAAYGRHWLNRRHGLALDDPWERLDERLHPDRRRRSRAQ